MRKCASSTTPCSSFPSSWEIAARRFVRSDTPKSSCQAQISGSAGWGQGGIREGTSPTYQDGIERAEDLQGSRLRARVVLVKYWLMASKEFLTAKPLFARDRAAATERHRRSRGRYTHRRCGRLRYRDRWWREACSWRPQRRRCAAQRGRRSFPAIIGPRCAAARVYAKCPLGVCGWMGYQCCGGRGSRNRFIYYGASREQEKWV